MLQANKPKKNVKTVIVVFSGHRCVNVESVMVFNKIWAAEVIHTGQMCIHTCLIEVDLRENL